MEPEVSDPGPIEQVFETFFHTLQSLLRRFRRKNPVIVTPGDEANILIRGLRHELLRHRLNVNWQPNIYPWAAE